uniref:GATA-type domain-containing protein n=1 Tax=Caenorhabditis tropicalis TaxID=1561998 RepID=A0A1I7TBR9_9PELO
MSADLKEPKESCGECERNKNETSMAFMAVFQHIQALQSRIEHLEKAVKEGSEEEPKKTTNRKRKAVTVVEEESTTPIEEAIRCANCNAEESVTWRRDEQNRVVCNPCGLKKKKTPKRHQSPKEQCDQDFMASLMMLAQQLEVEMPNT